MTIENDMEQAVAELLEAIKADYARGGWRDDMVEAFNASLKIRKGQKYIKVIKETSVWGFVVNTNDDPKFRRGDILKPASWSTPARNFARGNVIDGGYTVAWTGPRG